MNVPLFCPDPTSEQSQSLIEQCRTIGWLQVVSKSPSQTFLIIENGRLGLADASWPKVLPVFVDFESNEAQHRRLHGGGVGQAVAKAVGLNKRKDLTIWDATAGLGRDSFVMACLGANVTMFERNVLVNLLLKNGLDNLSHTSDADLFTIFERMKLIEGSICEDVTNVSSIPDVIYLDPMFPERQKSAKVKKEMSLFHGIVGADEDADSLLLPALELATYRVVVKRPKHAPLLAGRNPTTALVGKSSRFDVYSKKAIR